MCPLRPFTPDIFIKMIKDFFCFIYNVDLEHKVVINKETEINDLRKKESNENAFLPT